MGSEADILYNEDELISPEWMNTSFFERVLKSYENDSEIVVSDYKVSPASKKGDHYASVMYRIVINYKSPKSEKLKNISIILKTEPFVDGEKKDIIRKINLFDCEIKMYSETLPKMQKLINMTGDKRRMHPSLVYYSIDPAPVIIFEDVSPLGYETCKDYGVGHELSQLAFHRLGQIHAASMVLEENKIDITCYNKSVFDMNIMGEGLDMHMFSIGSFLEELKTWEGYEKYAEKVIKMLEDYNVKGRKTFSPNTTNGYNVLNHGDFHAKNMMYDNLKSPKDSQLLVIDFQICCYGSPAIDLIFGKYMLTTSDRKDELIEYYYKVFVDSLKKMKFKGRIPTFDDLQNELRKNGYYDVLLAVTCLPYQIVDTTNIFDDLFDPVRSIPMRKSFYQNLEVQKLLKKWLPEFLEKGYFDS